GGSPAFGFPRSCPARAYRLGQLPVLRQGTRVLCCSVCVVAGWVQPGRVGVWGSAGGGEVELEPDACSVVAVDAPAVGERGPHAEGAGRRVPVCCRGYR